MGHRGRKTQRQAFFGEDNSNHQPPPHTNEKMMERRDWSSLPELIVAMISNFLLSENVTEYIRFRAVCPGWRQSTAPPSKPLCRPIQQKRKRLRHVLFPSISFATAQTFYAGRFLAGTGHYRGSGSSTIFNFSRSFKLGCGKKI